MNANKIQKEIYAQRLAAQMRSAGSNNWAFNDIADLCELAGIWEKWLDAATRQDEENVALEAASILGVEIRHYIPA